MTFQEIIDFWFSGRTRERWWSKNPDFDQEIRDRFEITVSHAADGELAHWRASPEGRLAEIIVLDQFPRNMFRDLPSAFQHDQQARDLTRNAVASGADKELNTDQKAFLYMPLMHSESSQDHDFAVRLFSSDPALEFNLQFELRHKAIIDRFGRYPHRNEILGRTSTEEELEFLRQPGSSF